MFWKTHFREQQNAFDLIDKQYFLKLMSIFILGRGQFPCIGLGDQKLFILLEIEALLLIQFSFNLSRDSHEPKLLDSCSSILEWAQISSGPLYTAAITKKGTLYMENDSNDNDQLGGMMVIRHRDTFQRKM